MEIWIDAAPDVVFPYFIDQDKVARWLATSAKFDVRPGGSLRFVAHNDRLATGNFTIVEPPDRLAFTWGWEGNAEVPPGSTNVDVRFLPENDGTRVKLRHSGIRTVEWAGRHESRWSAYLQDLEALLGAKARA